MIEITSVILFYLIPFSQSGVVPLSRFLRLLGVRTMVLFFFCGCLQVDLFLLSQVFSPSAVSRRNACDPAKVQLLKLK